MPIDSNLLRVTVDLGAIQDNFRLLRSRGTGLIAVIKSDAYGHGLIPVAKALAESGADCFAVGTVAEATRLRPEVRGTVFALLGPQSSEEAREAVQRDIVPVAARHDQLTWLQTAADATKRRAAVALKFDTGMARLGFNHAEVDMVLETLAHCRDVEPRWLFSHLATADDPDQAEFVREQATRYLIVQARLQSGLTTAGILPRCSLTNSAGLLAYPELAWDRQRPGIALYGANPFHGTELEYLGRDLRPAMRVQAPVLAVHPLAKGASISYGRTFVADRDKTVAVVAAGYADAYSRGLSNKGWMLLRGQRVKVLGRVCMQMTAVDVSHVPGVAPGDMAVLLGPDEGDAITPEELSSWWGTIPYEVFCMLGMNPREYVASSEASQGDLDHARSDTSPSAWG
ncbi:alanine racemase [Desulfonatronum lacustre]|uniref:alanine racemase n=1 Tax=Desulfonatronum lacustre TaxID=66849 RepID=UPI000A037EFE|nr:alanine racemase [Desulfonatronum lacustre]